jgi:hypothetical protein
MDYFVHMIDAFAIQPSTHSDMSKMLVADLMSSGGDPQIGHRLKCTKGARRQAVFMKKSHHCGC